MKLSLSRLAALRPNKTWLLFGVALLIGLLAALGARSYLSNYMAAIEARSKSKTAALLVAKQGLKKGDALSTDTVAVRDVPVDYAHSNAITPEHFDRVEGQSVEHDVREGEILLWSLMQTKKAPSFSARVGIGRRAITVHVDEINSISGLLEPSDAIDLILTLEQGGKKTTFPLLQNVRVMATGQRVVDDPKSGERRQYSTVTLDTTQAQAQSVVIAREAGKITALLRNPQDTQVLAEDSAAMAALLGLAGDVQSLANSAGSTGRTVPVLYGGRRSDFKPEELTLRQAANQGGADEPATRAAPVAPPSGLLAFNPKPDQPPGNPGVLVIAVPPRAAP
ncbi:Flp pilus assembly protein CpaB [Verminephrobacter aporrectodeae subsp. tuberculatae]|uniref:Flp pilus assembly protein CpaB n=1 Tax=Verminephrobacter aporrectodeae TaxID=1110389 RepID=UPI0022431B76|nr:Flp pilus assembly protein CpaB [Verminephrobacter aporrectodeae]MCW8164150.1 Flp pilus assembly protein CpaB [Verminephrobacter aporrectodeae subsp. tuberculatae]